MCSQSTNAACSEEIAVISADVGTSLASMRLVATTV